MADTEIFIRNSEGRIAFTYTIVRAGRPVKTAEVEGDEVVAPGYYGGSEAMD